MKWILWLFAIIIALAGAFFILNSYIYQEKQSDEARIGGERTQEGCLVSAGYSFSETVGACVRESDLTPDIMEAARMAVEHVGEGYALTVVSFNSYEDEGSYDIFFERGEERTPEVVFIRDGEITPAPSHEDAERVGLQFMQDVIAIAPPSSDAEAQTRLYDTLSSSARANVSQDTLARDIAMFFGIQDVPDQGVSIEDLEVGFNTAELTLGLNYSGGRTVRNMLLVVEDGVWKVDEISAPMSQ